MKKMISSTLFVLLSIISFNVLGWDFPWIKFSTSPSDDEHIAACFKYDAVTKEDGECGSTGKNCACWVDIGPNVETDGFVCPTNPKSKEKTETELFRNYKFEKRCYILTMLA